jgi:hypothetical protein
MNIKLRNIYVNERMSEETTMFQAVLYIDNKRAGTAENRGEGGATFFMAFNEQGAKLISEAEEWCKKQPPHVDPEQRDPLDESKPASYDMDLELYVGLQITDYLIQKDIAKFKKGMEKHMVNGIVYGVPDSSYRFIKFQIPLSKFFEDDKKLVALKRHIDEKVIPRLDNGEKILNTNIPPEISTRLGITDLIVKIPTEIDQKRSVVKKTQRKKGGSKL